MDEARRDFLRKAGGIFAAAGVTAIAGCSSSCPDSGRPSAAETIAIDATPTGPFESVPGGHWPTEKGDAANTGFANTTVPNPPLSVRWSTQLDIPTEDGVGVVASAPVVGTDRVFVADPDRVHAVSLLSGELEWESETLPVTETERYSTYRPETIAPRVGPTGQVLVGLEDGLAALDPADGSVSWRRDSQEAVSPPTVVGETLIAQGSDSVRAYESDGSQLWQVSLSRGHTRLQPAASGDIVVLETDRGLQALSTHTGERLWSREAHVESAPVLDEGACFVGGDEGVISLDATDGTERFSYTRGDYMALQNLVVTPDSVYAVEQPPEAGAAAFALDRTASGLDSRWCSYVGDGVLTAATDGQVLGLLTLSEGPGSERSLVGFSADRGDVPWAVTGGLRSDTWLNPPAVLDEAFIITTRGGQTVAISGGE